MVRSYYLTKNKIVIKYSNGKKEILDLNPEILMEVINNLDGQIDYTLEEVSKHEDAVYRRLSNLLAMLTLIQCILTYFVFASFTHAFIAGIFIGIALSFVLLISSFVITIININKLKTCSKQYKVYEGRENLVKEYNYLLSKGATLVDVC